MPPIRDAVILAAGLGMRLRSIVDDRPKGLIEIEGETLVGRSVRLLGDAGIEDVTIVVGHGADAYERFASTHSRVRLVTNAAYATTGSMASLDAALDPGGPPVLVLESDIVYEARALAELLRAPPDATLLSGPTGAGDEVWIHAPDGWIRSMSKQAHTLPGVAGEFVGITSLSTMACYAMREAFAAFVGRHGHARMDYETGALVEVAQSMPIAAVVMPDLCWGEIDDDRQYQRVVREVWPVVTAQR